MRTLFSEWLDLEGYHVRSVGAASLPVEHDIDLVIFELVNLPHGAAEAARRVAAQYPGAKLIGTSTRAGRTLPAGSPQATALGVAGLVAKPCLRVELLAAVAGAIGSPF